MLPLSSGRLLASHLCNAPIAMACPHCGSWSVKADRSLAGRMVCGRCGRPLSGQAAGRAMRSGRSGGGGGAHPSWWARPGWGWLVLLVALSAALATLAPAPDRSVPPRRQPASSSGWR